MQGEEVGIWQPVTDVASGEQYWWNPETDETAWDRPLDDWGNQADPHGDGDADSAPEIGHDDGWEEAYDESSGATYYYNYITRQTAWERPAEAVAHDPSLDIDVDGGYEGEGGDPAGYAHEMREISLLSTLTGSSQSLHASPHAESPVGVAAAAVEWR